MSCRHELETKTRRDGDVTCISLISIGLNMKESETEIEKKINKYLQSNVLLLMGL